MKRGLSENKLNKNKSTNNKLNLIQKEKPKSLAKNKSSKNNENKKENKKSQYNIDLFTGIKEEFEKDKNANKNNNIYLNFYNKHTKNQVLQKESKISKKFFDNNVEYIKEKQEKYKLKKEEEEKIKKQKEREDTNEYRKEQSIKLYKMENVYKREIMKRKNQKLFSKSKEKIGIVAKNKNDIKNKKGEKIDEENIKKLEDGKEIKITKKEYDKKMDYFLKQSRLCLNELEKLPIANKTMKVYQRESQLNKYIKVLQDNIFKYQNHIGITIIE
jgi:hypothetical protein